MTEPLATKCHDPECPFCNANPQFVTVIWYSQQLPVRTPHRAYTWLVQHWPMVALITLFSLLVIWRVCK